MIFAIFTSDQKLMSRIYKEFLKSILKTIEKLTKDLKRYFTKVLMDERYKTELKYSSHQENKNSNHSEKPLPPPKND